MKETLVDRETRRRARWLKRVQLSTDLTPTEKNLAYWIYEHFNAVTRDCWPSQQTLANELNCSIKTVQRALRGLERKDFLKIRTFCRRRRYAPHFLPGDADRSVRKTGQIRPEGPDNGVPESNLCNPTEKSLYGAFREGNSSAPPLPYPPGQRGQIELQVARQIGSDGIEVLSILSRIDDKVVERLCIAFAKRELGEREIHAARLAAAQAKP